MSLLFNPAPPHHPMRLGPAMLRQLRIGKGVDRITVMFTHGQLHRIFNRDTDFGRTIRDSHPLEMTLAGGTDMEQKVDCRLFEAPWHIDLRTPKQKRDALKATTPGPTPPELSPQEREWNEAVFEDVYALAATEYRVLLRQVERTLLREHLRRQRDQRQAEDTPHE